ncbi:phage head-tail connector protein [Tuberibacillus calidus]|uniref:phage head-tail connector protein n=1 Tax=Tuberibacillus calidus TaxID=340097 RepID=UPI00040A5A8D|nr:phage head-tail connector protein [Tuberibacillus calidus]
MPTLENVKILLGIDVNDTSQDNVLNLYLSRATNFVLNYCNLEEIPVGLDSVVEDIAILKYRLKGVEGIKSEGKGSLSESYIDSLPLDIIRELNRYRRIEFI